jgi:hypothetical protein
MTNGPKCFQCGEPSHRIADCRKGEKYGKGLLIDSGNAFDDEVMKKSKKQPSTTTGTWKKNLLLEITGLA